MLSNLLKRLGSTRRKSRIVFERTPQEIYKALLLVQGSFPKSGKMSVHLIEPAEATGAFEGATQRGAVSALKNAWQLEHKVPDATFVPTDENDPIRNYVV
jgi:hypothetical protein